MGLQTWVAVLRKIWPVRCDLGGQELLCVSPPEPLAESPSEFLKPAPKTKLFCLPVATGMDFPRAYLGRLPVSLPLVPGTGPLVMLQDTAKARQGGWPTSSLHVNVPGSVFFLGSDQLNLPRRSWRENTCGLHRDRPCDLPSLLLSSPKNHHSSYDNPL